MGGDNSTTESTVDVTKYVKIRKVNSPTVGEITIAEDTTNGHLVMIKTR